MEMTQLVLDSTYSPSKSPEKIVIVSGGLDSVTLLHFLAKNEPGVTWTALTFNYGQRHVKEIGCATYHCDLLGIPQYVVDVRSIFRLSQQASALTDPTKTVPEMIETLGNSQPITYVPNRNMIFLTIGIGLAESLGANSVCYGAHLTDSHGYWDCTPDFVSRFNDLLNLQRRNRVKVRAPFVYKRKAEILKIGLSLDIDYSRTWSCYAGGDQPCGKCSTCVERGQAFAELGVEEPIYQGPVDDDLEVFNGQ